jgi:alpha-mannosidase
MDKLWKLLLINQFHDIIPGSSITRVYKEAQEQYDEIFATCNDLLDTAVGHLFDKSDNSLTLFNSLGCEYRGVITLPDGWQAARVDNVALSVQNEADGVLAEVSIPAYSFITLQKADAESAEMASTGNGLVLENDLIRYEFTVDGKLIRGYDKTEEYEIILQDKPANVLSVYHDDPVEYDAWDIDLSYENMHVENAIGISAEKIIDGTLRQVVEFELKISNSTIKQRVILEHGSKQLAFYIKQAYAPVRVKALKEA